ncbi:MAG: bug [Rhizobacter sp.]|jgi:tripartite-type tricarboxylate transporter receptor subunit TctC|nr:bug [Rhizobacter sp.]
MRMRISRSLDKWAAAALACIAACALPLLAHAEYPDRAIKIVVPFAAGGATDLIAREYAERLTREWKQPAIVDNRPGAGGGLGAQAVARSAPDGYTILLTNTAFVQAFLQPAQPIYQVKEFEPIVELTLSPIAFAVPTSLGVKTLPEFVKFIRTSRENYAYGSAGIGQTVHFYGELLRRMAGLDLPHVPYKGEAPFLTDLAGGQVAGGFATVASMRPYIEAGKIRPLAVPGTQRSPLLPNVPTLRELGYEGFDAVGWFGLLVPAGTPRPIVERLNAIANAMLTDPVVAGKLNELGLTPVGGSVDAFAQTVRNEPAVWAGVVKAADIKLD